MDIIMAINETARSTEDWEQFIGEQMRAIRLRKEITQEELASRAGLSVGAIKNLESGSGSTLTTLVKVCRALDHLEWIKGSAPRTRISPMQMLNANNAAVRQRASTKRGGR